LSLPTYPFERQRYWIEPSRHEINTNQMPLSKKVDVTDWFYLPGWKFSAPLKLQVEPKKIIPSCWLVFVDSYGLGFQLVERFQQLDQEIIIVTVGTEFTKVSKNNYTINPNQPEDYETLLNQLYTLKQQPQNIVHLWSITANEDECLKLDTSHESEGNFMLERLETIQSLGFYSLLFLTQALGKQNTIDEIQLSVISNNIQSVTTEETLSPEKATLLGPIKVTGQEYPNIHCCSIDVVISSKVEIEQKLVELLLTELITPTIDKIVAYRGQQRWIPTFEPVKLSKPVNKTLPLRERGTYLITGGLGNIGLLLAEYLAKTMRAQLILTGRSAFPNREQWEEWLASHDEQNIISSKIRKLQSFEEQGASVWVTRADVANLQQMQAVIIHAEKRFGRLNGVIHAAGIVGNNLVAMEKMDKVHSEQDFQPKVYGTLILERVLKHKNLDFCILMSSLSSILGGLGFCSYSAANLFIDAFTIWHNQTSQVPWLSVNWDGWRFEDDTQQTNTSVGAKLLELAITPSEGIEAFQRVLSSYQINQLVVSTGNLQTRIDQWMSESKSPLANAKSENVFQQYSRPNLSNSYVEPRNSLEHTLTAIWQTLLGIEPVGIYDDFFELGGDSLLGTRVISKMRHVSDVGLPIQILFEKPTIAGIAEHIEEMRSIQNLMALPSKSEGQRMEGVL
jgi:acyl transferase domain-containing protein